MGHHISRRQFLGTLAAASAAAAFSSCTSISSNPNSRRKAKGRKTQNDKVQIGFIGIGWQGGANLDSALNVADCRVVAIADVDESHLNGAVNRVNAHYQDKCCKGYKDFRELIARGDLDAVCISTPDHWHAIPAIMAADAGLDIFCEKPLSHSLGEGIAMVEAVQRNGRIWQTGSWQRSQGLFRWAAEIVQNGYLGKVTHVEVGLPGGHNDFEGTGSDKPDGNPPAGVDYDFWTGPAKIMPFNPCRFHKNWRWNYNTGGGQLMDWIGHHCDIAHWGLANPEFGCGPDDEVGPLEVSATADFPDPKAVWNTATKYRIECKYPSNVEVLIAGGYKEIGFGTKWTGPNGWLFVSRDTIRASNLDFVRDVQSGERAGNLKVQLYKSPGHMQEFVDSVKSRKRTLTPVEVAHRSQTPGHLGYIAAVTGRKLKWDAASQRIIGDSEASRMIMPQMRAPWHV